MNVPPGFTNETKLIPEPITAVDEDELLNQLKSQTIAEKIGLGGGPNFISREN